ncbi:DUF3576 domain-containing protein [Parvularcula sp. LCG005]|uniref:DUF3576 domain-containing protein n=1 Tax=Parvularcula sp. LCG005 TaxID=3078805 RepID=UPI0029432A5B|nr:DUF3576 domain-containing protein [Parvularcula sp. LCG005]WOI53223.1 DUF3576 domain-containing protein [Parvularcula sp. LCG005]
MRKQSHRLMKIFGLAGAAAALAACASSGPSDRNAPLATTEKSGTMVASVNRYLWRASLDTIDFMPMANADPVAGLIQTEWYGNPNLPQERFKTNVYILDTALRADALRVSVFRQVMTEQGWIDAPTNPATAAEIENAILTRARELRLNSLDG